MPARSQTSTSAIVAAGRTLLEEHGMDDLTMRDVADAVGVRTPSLYKRVRNRSDLFRLILEDVIDELTVTLDNAAGSGDTAVDLRALVDTYRTFAHANPVTYTLMWAPHTTLAAGARERMTVTLVRLVTDLVGPRHALSAARTIVAWAHGFITMELSGAFRLGGVVQDAWDFGLGRVLRAIQPATDG